MRKKVCKRITGPAGMFDVLRDFIDWNDHEVEIELDLQGSTKEIDMMEVCADLEADILGLQEDLRGLRKGISDMIDAPFIDVED